MKTELEKTNIEQELTRFKGSQINNTGPLSISPFFM